MNKKCDANQKARDDMKNLLLLIDTTGNRGSWCIPPYWPNHRDLQNRRGGALKRSRLALGSLDTFHKFAEKQLLVYNFHWGEDAPYIIKERNWSLDALI